MNIRSAYIKKAPLTTILRNLGIKKEDYNKCLTPINGLHNIDMMKVNTTLNTYKGD